ncbi:hypothetical protein AZF37_05005 [endosymbiont 'TC1' of Trimyema compressum]|uniref:protein translocase subunit SecF n=1 Tax=endosymbiont 'TC1' of Trimyema compressum TaxID=243899 RepID=UPI0007F08870|nr:protein translocase subunit SecF [endosymbiont 'TC1' of Trimyema compressum]AMP20617.1 hypothetical protein AZF37_05005 [endosymbiont 'TC1' of Trimyema compressum]
MKIINFMGKKKIIYIVTVVLLLASFIAMFTKGFNLGPDFAGGTLLEIKLSEHIATDDIKAIFKESDIQETEANHYIIKGSALSEEEYNNKMNQLKEKFGQIEVVKNDTVSGVIGSELSQKAILALALASLGIIIYLTIRFELFFGIGGILSSLHDIIVLLGIFALFQIQIGMSFIAAILTIVGYSINDTIVIYDRIRENLKVPSYQKDSKELIVNRSITQTLGRSITTVVCVLIVLISLYFLGSSSTHEFTLAMIIGTIIGMYSSIAVASPLWLDLSRKFSGKKFLNNN